MAIAEQQPHEASAYQRRILEFVANDSGHAVVQATAGSGKTTTLIAVAKQLPASERACFLAFNRATAAELKARLPPHVEATTIHALGRRLLLGRFPHLRAARPEGDKYRALAVDALAAAAFDRSSRHEASAYLARLLGFVRLELTPAADAAAVAAVEQRYGLENPFSGSRRQAVRSLLTELLERGRAVAALGRFDLTDLVYLPVVMGLSGNYSFVCVDEAQDLSRLTLAFVQRLIETGARALFVGDPHQAIYGFAGADDRSLARIVKRTGATTLPLSVSYRCPARHVLLARRFSPAMEAAPGAAMGGVTIISVSQLPRRARPGDLVMSRVNAPLVGLSLRLLEGDVPARVLGIELLDDLLRLARTLFPEKLPLNAPELTLRHGRASAARIERRLLSSLSLARALSDDADRHQALAILLSRLRASTAPFDLERLSLLAHRLFGVASPTHEPEPTAAAVVLSTIHKAKGREAQRTFLLYPEELAAAATELDDRSAEANVLFVAITRAKHELVLVERRPGAIAARIRRHRNGAANSSGSGGKVPDQWTQVLALARTMARAKRS